MNKETKQLEWEQEYDNRFGHQVECELSAGLDECTCYNPEVKKFISSLLAQGDYKPQVEEWEKEFDLLYIGSSKVRIKSFIRALLTQERLRWEEEVKNKL